jgi:hypothetical protein
MKNHNPAGRNLRFAGARERLTAVIVLVAFAALVWAAWSGRFDDEIQQILAWIRDHYRKLAN